MFKKKKNTDIIYEEINLNIKQDLNVGINKLVDDGILIPVDEENYSLPTCLSSSGETLNIISNVNWFEAQQDSSVRRTLETSYYGQKPKQVKSDLSTAIIGESSMSKQYDWTKEYTNYLKDEMEKLKSDIYDSMSGLYE